MQHDAITVIARRRLPASPANAHVAGVSWPARCRRGPDSFAGVVSADAAACPVAQERAPAGSLGLGYKENASLDASCAVM